MFEYNIISKPIRLNSNKKVIDNIFETIEKKVEKSQNWVINIIFESDEVIRELNKWYRTIDKTTDVLSFHYFDTYDGVDKKTVAWEIILSSSKIESQAAEYWIKDEEELYKLLIHSILHLLWYDHETDEDYEEMNKLEKEIETDVNEKFGLNIK
ncbi:MAG: hypothetical protein ACD_3C00111G0008 [uncultured bacterium (gcode 4)]|uniref:Endoribonuclease YbeY n=1 Tax=uncultured bacterium (gcode 4) TaxID=1234023 RepID=K2FA31_9BACT|nr:MAG: hypothetical protein ACD_3C00111G0008 [uncultured bacterium (gcode 4)]